MARLSLGPIQFRTASAVFATLLVGLSVMSAVVPPLRNLLLLAPSSVIGQFFVWQLVTYTFVELSPIGVIFGALMTYQMGLFLEARWGTRRFVTFTLGIAAAAAAATTLLTLLVPMLFGAMYSGGWVMAGSLWVAYGLTVGRGQTNFWGIAVSGNMFALIGAGFVALNAAFGSVFTVVPEVFALTFTYLVIRGSFTNPWLRFRSWRLERDLKRRSAHLRSVDGGKRNGSNGSDRYLH